MIKILLFDFDGVITETINVKTQAFRDLFSDYPEAIEEIARYHRGNGGISRFVKIRHIYNEILKKNLTETMFEQLCQRYSKLVKEKVINADLVPGAQELLDYAFGKFKMFVVSGTPQEEMREIVKKRRMDKYFQGIYGAPTTKSDIINKILREESLKKNEVIFVGDAVNDFEAAVHTGIRFCARVTPDSGEWIKDNRIEVKVNDLDEFNRYLNKD
jgi:HAD superfamily hydrolase (TIGR01549 family)